MAKRKDVPEGQPVVEEILRQIKIAPLKTNDELTAAMTLINEIKTQIDPMSIAMLQLQAIIKHYNLNRRAGDEEMTVADALLLRLKDRKNHSGG